MTVIRTEIFVETRETCIIRRRRFFIRAFCRQCGREVTWLSPAEAAFLTCREPEEIFSMIDSNKIHVRYLKEEKPFVCLPSACLD